MENKEKIDEIIASEIFLTAYESDFLDNMSCLIEDNGELTEDQEQYLNTIYDKV